MTNTTAYVKRFANLLLGAALVGAAGAAASCPIDGSGGPCAAAAGNPINVMTGNKYQQETDLPALPGTLGLEIVRHYNSNLSRPSDALGIMGRGWKLSYEATLLKNGRNIEIREADGTLRGFNCDLLESTHCESDDHAHGVVERLAKTASGSDYLWNAADGTKWRFNAAGKPVQIESANGAFVSLQYDSAQLLVSVTDPQGRKLQLHYLEREQAHGADRFRGVQWIDTPVGRFSYGYGSALPKGATLDKSATLANLTEVVFPVAKAGAIPTGRRYHYEDAMRPTFLTGITVVGADSNGKPLTQRYATYGYNIDGQAILSTHANGVGKVTLDYSIGGRTVLTNSLGQQTTYRYRIIAGQWHLLEVRGAGCATCITPNVRFNYDTLGRETEVTQLTPDGQPIQTLIKALDYYGRPLMVSRVRYQNGKAGAPEWQERYEYGAGITNNPTLIARPSVVPGQEAATRIVYNKSEQPVSVTESGWAPALDGKGQATAIERTTRYVYARINGRSLLTQIDGPLANGATDSPIDSDITHVDWDGKGDRVLAMTTPGNFKSTFAYDDIGRLTKVKNLEGVSTEFAYDTFSRQTAVTQGDITETATYDAAGNQIETGYRQAGAYRPLTLAGFDNAGRNIWSASHLGILDRQQFDTEGNLLEVSTATGHFQRKAQLHYDAQGRIDQMTGPAGAVRTLTWNDADQLASSTDALGRVRRFDYSNAAHLGQVANATRSVDADQYGSAIRLEYATLGADSTVVAPNGAKMRTVTDDFGRTIATDSADSGLSTRSFDAADRLIASTDAAGNHARYEYDTAGRIVRQTVVGIAVGASAEQTALTVWSYAGKKLIAVAHPNQNERYQYDDRGRLAGKVVEVKLANGKVAISATRYHYDTLDQLTSLDLPDGSALVYVRNGQNQITGIERSRIQTAWLRWLLPSQTIVKDIERDIVGLKRFTYGNGIEAHFQRSAEGVLARVVYLHPAGTSGNTVTAALSTTFERLLGIQIAQASAPPVAPVATNVVMSEPGALGIARDLHALIDHRYLWDLQGNLLFAQGKHAATDYAYDGHDRLIAARTSARSDASVIAVRAPTAAPVSASEPATPQHFERYFYDSNGNRVLAQEASGAQSDLQTNTHKTAYETGTNRWQRSDDAATGAARYDVNGQPVAIGDRAYVWDALGKLLTVRDATHTFATYRYNHRGQRVSKDVNGRQTAYLYEDGRLSAELDTQGKLTRQYLYLADQPIAIVDTTAGQEIPDTPTSAFRQVVRDVSALYVAWIGRGASMHYLHNNHLGATEMVTDSVALPEWQADYLPFGKVLLASSSNPTGSANAGHDTGNFKFNLRLPGQYEDDETGLYYNDHRYYDPQRGQYLTPDPLGLRGGINSYAYVSGNPLRYVDPTGLILFAFDGSDNSNPPPINANGNQDDFSNVYKFFKAYDSTQNGPKWYMNGVGRDDPDSHISSNLRDDKDGNTARARVDYMLKQLDNYLTTTDFSKNSGVDIDIVGFSRGAAMGRDFSNRVAKSIRDKQYARTGACLQLRFMGLWDTVAQFGANGAGNGLWQLAIPAEARYVFHAVALNEHRYLFPGESIGRGIQRGFIGSHADIGGSYGTGDLSNVALNWIVEQAKASGVKMYKWGDNGTDKNWGRVKNPVLHDKSSHAGRAPEDRDFCLRKNNEVWATDCKHQRFATPGGLTWGQTLPFISMYARPTLDADGVSKIVGTIKMEEYAAWLNKNYGLTIQFSPP